MNHVAIIERALREHPTLIHTDKATVSIVALRPVYADAPDWRARIHRWRQGLSA